MPETPDLHIPYPSAADAITDWPAQAQELAERVEAVLLAAAEELAYVQRVADFNGAGDALTLPAIAADAGDAVWLEVWAMAVHADPLSIAGGGAAITPSIEHDGAAVMSLRPINPSNATDGGQDALWLPYYVKRKYTFPVADAAAVFSFAITGGTVRASAGSPAWMRATPASA